MMITTPHIAQALTDAGYPITMEHVGGGLLAATSPHPNGGTIVANEEGVYVYAGNTWTDADGDTPAHEWHATGPETLAAYVQAWRNLYTAGGDA